MKSSTNNQKTGQKNNSIINKFVFIPVIVAIIVALVKISTNNDPIECLIPNFLLFTPFRKATVKAWADYLKIDKAIVYEPAQVPVIQAEDFSMEALKKATNNWRHPAVVRGLFKDSPASKLWLKPDYLPSKIGEFRIPVVQSAVYGGLQNNRSVMTFGESFKEIIADSASKMYLFFPVKSRFNYNHSELGKLEILQKEVDKVTSEDLELGKRIWQGFGTSQHSTFFGAQFVIGQGSNDSEATTGTGWHCAAGNNWFVQVAGRKRWYFLDQQYSSYMFPLRGGRVNMMTGVRNMGELQKHLPLRFTDLGPGDLLYNPDWEWHTIKNYEGLSIGVPIREVNVSLTFRNNFQYTMIVLLNKAFDRIGIDIGGYPPSS